MPVDHSFCKHAVAAGEPLVLPDTRRHPAHWDNPTISELGIIAYAGIPLIDSDGQALGTLCVIDARPRAWTDRQIRMLRDLAASVMTEIELRVALRENERLAEQEQVLALLKERERIAMDLHDGTIQSLYAVALGLRAQARSLDAPPNPLALALDRAISQVNAIIQDIRNYIFDLRPEELAQHGLRSGIELLADELRVNTLLQPRLKLATEVDDLLGPDAQADLLAVAREATSNVIRHAGASRVTISLSIAHEQLALLIRDNGRGFQCQQTGAPNGNGLRNMGERARALGGRLVVASRPGRGTSIRLVLPLRDGPPP
jgi:signal transduction histidine kinase